MSENEIVIQLDGVHHDDDVIDIKEAIIQQLERKECQLNMIIICQDSNKTVMFVAEITQMDPIDIKVFKDTRCKIIATPDIVYMFTDALLDNGEPFQNVNHEREYQMLLEIEWDGKIIRRPLNIKSLEDVIQMNPSPKILHITCHGVNIVWETTYLHIEEEGTGKKIDLSAQDLEKILNRLLDKKDNGIKLVFVTACHGEDVGKMFAKKMPFVISV